MTYQFFDLPGGEVVLHPQPSLGYDPDYLFDVLRQNAHWEQRWFNFGGKPVAQPRLIAWYSEYSYTYSGIRLNPNPMTPMLEHLAAVMSTLTGSSFNGVLLNYYLDGKSSISMHADDEPEFGLEPVIASLSLGAERSFILQRKDKSLAKLSIPLTHGGVLVMAGQTQENWDHGISKTKELTGPRINLTFRNIVYPEY